MCIYVSNQSVQAKKIWLPKADEQDGEDAVHNQVRPKPEQYADRTWMPPRGTRRSMGKR